MRPGRELSTHNFQWLIALLLLIAIPVSANAESLDRVVTVNSKLVQNKILHGDNGSVVLALTLRGSEIAHRRQHVKLPVDLVVVLDRSGSMEGEKIQNSREAIIQLTKKLSPEDRMAVISYSNNVVINAPLTQMTNFGRQNIISRVRHIQAGGGTNLGSGLDQGISTLKYGSSHSARQRTVILISDGLANQGITSPYQLGYMAANGVEHSMRISTVGVGYDFNELLMTTIADHGAGNYYFLENPRAFARIFEKELDMTQNIVAGGLEIRIPLSQGISLADAGGYPISIEGNYAIIRPGDLLSGQTRTIYLTFSVPSNEERNYSLGNAKVQYDFQGIQQEVIDSTKLEVACVADNREVEKSIDKAMWSKQVVKNDYSKLKESVATSIRNGNKDAALKSISKYEQKQRSLNRVVESDEVQHNLDNDLQELKQSVEDTFAGSAAEIAGKKKQQAKILQYESYKTRRDKQ